MKITKIPGGVTAARGFQAACCAAGIKYQGRTDMAMLYCEVPCAAAGTYTTNLVKAAPVLWDQEIVQQRKTAQAVVVNAGIANAGTGEKGMELCKEFGCEAVFLNKNNRVNVTAGIADKIKVTDENYSFDDYSLR